MFQAFTSRNIPQDCANLMLLRNVKWKATKCEQCAWRTTRGVCYASRIRPHIAGKNETLIQLIFAL